jgi:transcriptional regulator with XRE-family HTH domain
MNPAVSTFGREQLQALGKLLRQMRDGRSWSLKRLAGESGISIAAIQKIEAGEANASLITVIAIAEALGGSIDQLIAASCTESRVVQVVRGHAEADEASARDLTEDLLDARMHGRLLRLKPRANLAADERPSKGPILAYVLDGALRLAFGDDTIEMLRTGDAIHVKGDMPTAWSNPLARRSLVLCLADRRPAPAQ